jgi:choline transport protein
MAGCLPTACSSEYCSASVVALVISYALPIIIHCAQGRRKLLPRPFAMAPALGWLSNVVGVAYALLTSVLFMLTPRLPVTVETVNYWAFAIALILVLSVVSWLSYGRKHYLGPAMLRHDAASARSVDGGDSEDSGSTPLIHDGDGEPADSEDD